MAVHFYISRGKESTKKHIKMLEDTLTNKNKTFLEMGLHTRMSVLGQFNRGEADCLIMYDVEQFGYMLQSGLVKTFRDTSKYRDIYLFIEVLDSGYDFTCSPLYNTYSYPKESIFNEQCKYFNKS